MATAEITVQRHRLPEEEVKAVAPAETAPQATVPGTKTTEVNTATAPAEVNNMATARHREATTTPAVITLRGDRHRGDRLPVVRLRHAPIVRHTTPIIAPHLRHLTVLTTVAR